MQKFYNSGCLLGTYIGNISHMHNDTFYKNAVRYDILLTPRRVGKELCFHCLGLSSGDRVPMKDCSTAELSILLKLESDTKYES